MVVIHKPATTRFPARVEFVMALNDGIDPSSPRSDARPFWPTRKELRECGWVALLFACLMVVGLAPLALIPLLWLLPAGDDWPIVATRIGLVIGVGVGWRIAINAAARFGSRVFRGRLPASFGDDLLHESPPTASLTQALRENWSLLVVASVGLAVFLGWLDFNNPALNVANAPRRGRGVIVVLQWCQGNPNTVSASALIVFLGSLGLYLYRAFTAWRRGTSIISDARRRDEHPSVS